MIIVVDINVKGFFGNLLERLLYMVKITKWPIVKDIGHFLTKEKLSGVI